MSTCNHNLVSTAESQEQVEDPKHQDEQDLHTKCSTGIHDNNDEQQDHIEAELVDLEQDHAGGDLKGWFHYWTRNKENVAP